MSKNQRCSFCGKPKEETRRLISGPDGVCICDECIEICQSMIDEWQDEKETAEEVALKKPAEI
ncbi:MAG: ATP-dependent Clp protease ATP-binding subunit ClpX, partial [Clostridia bacterium]|nr:ATP-dependent Clp protease ATP-binding subunit ClpX [Clostridia bacterium]